jgi:hypothetical protein
MRQIHLDFHTAPQIPDVGADWDADHFVQTLQKARVNSITVFATCHHGMCYYPSKVGTVHPSLKFRSAGRADRGAAQRGIRAPIYVTVVWNVDAAMRHPRVAAGGQRTADRSDPARSNRAGPGCA